MDVSQRTTGNGSLRKLLYLTHTIGGLAGLLILSLFAAVIGPHPRLPLLFVLALAIGLLSGTVGYLVVRALWSSQLRRQLEQLRQLTAGADAPVTGRDPATLDRLFGSTVDAIRRQLQTLHTTIDEFVPHYRTLADASGYLSARAADGLQAAEAARKEVEGMHRKQQDVLGEVENLNGRAQNEAAISRELSASLEAMAAALEHSGQKFLDTSHGVDEVVATIHQATAQVAQVARSMETTAHDLDRINEALDGLRQAVTANAGQADEVRGNAEQGLQVVETFLQEMQRIDQEGRKAVVAMQNLAAQTDEVAKILEVIKELVSDTELLAFNAAIIAAKAGAEGRGFSVVADEIRDLADRTTASAGEIEAIVKSIREETRQVGASVESTGRFIGRGVELSHGTGDALRKILSSSAQAALSSGQLAETAGAHGQRVRALVEDAGRSLRSVRAIAQGMQRQEEAVTRIQDGVREMQAAADQVARGFDEQVRATREFDRSLMAREEQVGAIHAATRFQMAVVTGVLEHFTRSEQRLHGNAAKAAIITAEINALERLARDLHEQAGRLQSGLS